MWEKDRLLHIWGRPQWPVRLKLDKNHLHSKGNNQVNSDTHDGRLMFRIYKDPREFSNKEKK